MIDVTKQDLKLSVWMLISMCDGLLKVCEQNGIEIGEIEIGHEGKLESFKFTEVLDAMRHRFEAPTATVTAQERS